jgi:hypothetical protein
VWQTVVSSAKQWLLQCQTVLYSAHTGFIFPDQGMARAIPGHTGSSAPVHDLVYVQQKEHVDNLGRTYLWAIASTSFS